MPAPDSTDQFLSMTRQSQLVADEELDSYLKKHDGALPDTPSELAGCLVRDGLLTGFQAGQVLKGKWRGFVIAGKYKLLEHLGTGGMGTVYLCEHVTMHRRVAIKVLPPAQAKDPGAVERFYREARAVAALDHPNIVRAYDIDHDGKNHFLVMEYVDGPSLADVVHKRGPLGVARACNYMRQAAAGLHHAHVAGLVHRDVKPGNLLVDRGAVVKVLDMGLARFFNDRIDDITRRFDDNAALGTADFLAPEQALDSHGADRRADIYSLGATLYAVLTARTPFGPGTAMEKMMRHQTQQPTPLGQLRPDAPAELAAVIARMMAKSPAGRYQTAAEVYQALAPWDTEPAHPPSEDELPLLSPRSQGPGSSARAPGFAITPSALLPRLPEARSTATAVTAVPASGTSAAALPAPAPQSSASALATPPAPVLPRGHDWRGWAIIGTAAVLIFAAAIFGIHWALSSRGPAAGVQPPPVEGKGADPALAVSIGPDATRQYVRHVHTARYDAVVDDDGNLSSLKVGGTEFFKTGVPLHPGQPSRGAFLYSDATGETLTFAVEAGSGHVLTARNVKATVAMAFAPASVDWTIKNTTRNETMDFCIVFDPAVTAVWDNGQAWMAVPPPLPEKVPPGYRVELRWEVTSWFAGDAKLTLTGGTETWGPAPTARDRYQVWQVTLPPGATRQVTARVDRATPQELAEVAKLRAPPVEP